MVKPLTQSLPNNCSLLAPALHENGVLCPHKLGKLFLWWRIPGTLTHYTSDSQDWWRGWWKGVEIFQNHLGNIIRINIQSYLPTSTYPATRPELTHKVRKINLCVFLSIYGLFTYGHVRVFKIIQVDTYYINIWA